MKPKLIFILMAVLCFGTLSHAQTKEEALEWLKNNTSIAFVPLKPISSSVPEHWTEEEWKKDLHMLGSKIKYINQDSLNFFSNWGGGGKLQFDEILYEGDLEKMEKILDIGTEFHGFLLVIKMTNNRAIKYYTTPEKEADVKRVLKAIMHIAKLSGAKENKQIF